MLHCNGVGIPERFERPGSMWSKVFIRWLKEDVQLLSSTRNSLDLLIRQVETIRMALLEATKVIRSLSQTERYRRKFDLLMTVPGIGISVSMCILTEVYDIKRFHNEREFAAYLGLIPTCRSCGEKVAHGEMTFRGNKQIGPMLIEAAWITISKDPGLGSLYMQYKQRMKPQVAIIRIAKNSLTSFSPF